MRMISFKPTLANVLIPSLFAVALATPSSAKAATDIFEDANFVEELVEHFIDGLAKNQGFTRLVKGSTDDAEPGAVYYLRTPVNCQSDLRKATASGERIEINRSFTLDSPLSPQELKGRVTGLTPGSHSVRLSSFLGKGAALSISAKTGKAEAEINAALQAIAKTDAQVLYGKLEYDSYPINQATKAGLQSRGIAKAKDMASEATGAVAPFAQLIFQKFEFNQERLLAADAGVGGKFFEMIRLKLVGTSKEVRGSAFSYPTNAVFAFKYEPMLFNCD